MECITWLDVAHIFDIWIRIGFSNEETSVVTFFHDDEGDFGQWIVQIES